MMPFTGIENKQKKIKKNRKKKNPSTSFDTSLLLNDSLIHS